MAVTKVFKYTAQLQIAHIPIGVASIDVYLWGGAGGSGGSAEDAGFIIYTDGSFVLSASFTDVTMPAGSGILTNLNIDTGVSIQLCLQNVIISDPSAIPINSCPEYWQLTCIPIP